MQTNAVDYRRRDTTKSKDDNTLSFEYNQELFYRLDLMKLIIIHRPDGVLCGAIICNGDPRNPHTPADQYWAAFLDEQCQKHLTERCVLFYIQCRSVVYLRLVC